MGANFSVIGAFFVMSLHPFLVQQIGIYRPAMPFPTT